MLTWLRRRGWLVIVVVIAVTLISLAIGQSRSKSYSADAILIVPSGADVKGPGAANEALQLANSYVQLIPRDDEVLNGAGSTLRLPPTEVAKRLTVSTVSGTSLLRLRYEAPSSEAAVTGATAIARAVLDNAKTTVPKGSVVLVALPRSTNVVASGGGSNTTSLALGLILGLALGLLLAVAWDRTDRRVDNGDQLGYVLGTPGARISQLTAARAQALAQRWESLGGQSPLRVALVAGAPGQVTEVAYEAQRLAQMFTAVGHPAVQVGVEDANRPVHPDVEVVLISGGHPGAEGGEAAALASDLTCIVALRGARVGTVLSARRQLTEFGRPPTWGLLRDKNRKASSKGGPSVPGSTPRGGARPATVTPQDRALPVAPGLQRS
jgi:capsular polysaccharide biosynthesis protein